LGAAGTLATAAAPGASQATGLALRFEGGGSADAPTSRTSGSTSRAPPRPALVPAGPFTAVWTGTVTVDLRGDYRFQAEFAGAFDLGVNGTNILRSAGSAGVTEWSPSVREEGLQFAAGTLGRTGATKPACG
jgi:hypothetical protein